MKNITDTLVNEKVSIRQIHRDIQKAIDFFEEQERQRRNRRLSVIFSSFSIKKNINLIRS